MVSVEDMPELFVSFESKFSVWGRMFFFKFILLNHFVY